MSARVGIVPPIGLFERLDHDTGQWPESHLAGGGGLAIDTGGGNFGTRDTFIGLTGPSMGTLQLGFLTSSARAMGGIFDINKAGTGIGMSAALLGKLGNLAVTMPR